MSEIVEATLKAACKAFSEARAVYPDGEAETPITDWFDLDPKDAVDFGVLTEPKWNGHSDIGNMQQEAYVAAVIREPMRAALRTALSEAEQRARREALEEAAILAGSIGDEQIRSGSLDLEASVDKIIVAIRALIPSEPHDAEGRE
ncbi:hypothetical protein [Agrobacterium larrymoorei]|uniref:hypothetical protein n=1 Tax=Agrobacterium larrymoorei TaxID=160699 RepID=UPI0030BC34B1